MWEGKRILLLFTAFFCFCVICPAGGDAGVPALSDDAKACLECHGQQGINFLFQNKESRGAYVDAEKFKASVHGSLGCSGCHSDFSKDSHPQRMFRSKEQYAIKSALVCRQCHSDEQIKKSPVHAALLAKEGAPVCTACHSPHVIIAVAGGKTTASEKQYCLGCHRHDLTMTMRNGETVSLKADTAAMDASVHAKLSCFDCHFGFSMTEHPKRNFKTARDFSLAHAESCRRCHFDKYTKTMESIHYTMLSQGNLKAPVCTDCHGAHSVAQARVDRVKSARRCEKCHADIYNTYVTSVHGSALVNEQNADVPICVDCHTAHTILDARTQDFREKVPEICGQCHANKDLMEKYGLYTGVVNSYLQDFHGVTLKLYKQEKAAATGVSRKSIATCVDCHGVHDITRTSGPGTNLVKARLVKRCQKCHPGAGEEFPDAWLSHYEPSLSNAPLVFVINLMYTILIPFMLIGLILQILLHIWRYAVNR
jgi:predicted CXXCH cytochrome family protein